MSEIPVGFHNFLVVLVSFCQEVKLNVLLSHFQVLKNKLWGWLWPKWGVIYHVWLKRNNKRNGEIIWIQRKLVHENFYKECRLFLLFPEEKNQRMQIFLGIDPLGNGSLWQFEILWIDTLKMSIDHDFAQKKCVCVTDGIISLLVFSTWSNKY